MNQTTLSITEISDLSGEEEIKTVVIDENVADLDITDFTHKFLIPLLSAVGYMEKNIEELFGDYYG